MTIAKKISFWPFACLLLLAGCIVLWFTRGCGSKPSPAITQNDKVNDSAAKIFAQMDERNLQVRMLTDDTVKLHTDLKHARDSLKRSTIAIHAANSQVTALANEVADARIRRDTTAYRNACDSLANAAKANQAKFDMFERDNKNALAACDALSLKKSHIITALTSEANGYKSAGQLLQKQNGVLAKALTPHTKLFVGLDAIGSNALLGAGADVMLMTKTEKVYTLGGGLLSNGQPYVMLSGHIKIQLHK